MIYVALDYLEVPTTGKNCSVLKRQIFRGKKIVIAIALSRPLLKTQLKYSNNLNRKGNRALGTGK